MFFFFVCQHIEFTKQYFSNPKNIIANFQFYNWINAYGIPFNGNCEVFLYPLWFMCDLIVVTLLYPLFKMVINKYPRLVLGMSCLMIMLPFDFPLKVAISFFLLGGCIVKLSWHMEIIDKIPLLRISISYFLLILLKLIYPTRNIDGLLILVGIMFFIKLSKNNIQV